MVLIFGGTTEGRICAKVCEEAGKVFYYSTKSAYQQIELHHGVRVSGGMNAQQMKDFIRAHDIRMVIDAAHPFAEELHRNIDLATQALEIPVIRYERAYPQSESHLVWFDTYADAVKYLNQQQFNKLLALTGVNTIQKLKPYWQNHNTWFRIINRSESNAIARDLGFPQEKIIYFDKEDDELALLHNLKPDAVITKESGESGGFQEKVDATRAMNLPLLVVRRPKLSSLFISVYGIYGLRRTIEQLLPSYFELRIGFTTGSSATAATKAALLALITQTAMDEVIIHLPSGEPITIPTQVTSIGESEASAFVIKDAGDDPDVTHGHAIASTVSYTGEHSGVRFLQGQGVGKVTLPGLDIPIGDPAINKTPRLMIQHEIQEVLLECGLSIDSAQGIDVKISVPEGEQLAEKTFNPRLGIVGGISIIGTSGVVKPFSSDAFIGSIRREIQVAKALKVTHIVFNSGAKSERYLKELYPDFITNAFIQYGNFIGEALNLAHEEGIQEVTLGVMLGKAVKLAEGHLNTHSKEVVMNKEFILNLAQELNYSDWVIEEIKKMTLARQLWQIIPSDDLRLFQLLLKHCQLVCKPQFPNGKLNIYLITEKGEIIGG